MLKKIHVKAIIRKLKKQHVKKFSFIGKDYTELSLKTQLKECYINEKMNSNDFKDRLIWLQSRRIASKELSF